MKSLTPQSAKVLKHLLENETLTPVSALVNYQIADLSREVSRLTIDHDIHIYTDIKRVGKKRYASYKLCGICGVTRGKELAASNGIAVNPIR